LKFLVCGGLGFIGSAFVWNHLENFPSDKIINSDKIKTEIGWEPNLILMKRYVIQFYGMRKIQNGGIPLLMMKCFILIHGP